MALNLAPFGRWTLRDKAAQRRLALRWRQLFAGAKTVFHSEVVAGCVVVNLRRFLGRQPESYSWAARTTWVAQVSQCLRQWNAVHNLSESSN